MRMKIMTPTDFATHPNDKQNLSLTSVSSCSRCLTSRLVTRLLQQEGGAATQPADCGNPTNPPPIWLDRRTFKRGQAFFHHNFMSVFVGNLVGLVCLLAYENILKVLVSTGQSSTPSKALTRYLGTVTHVRSWYSGDVWDPSTPAFKSLQQVRRIHSSTHLVRHAQDTAISSQLDMVVTQWAFFGLVITHGRELGVNYCRKDLEALVHFWRGIGYLLGIEDRYNLCVGSLEEVETECHALLHQILVPAMSSPPAEFQGMAEALLEATSRMILVVNPPGLMAFIRHLLELPPCQESSLTWKAWMTYRQAIYVFGYVHHLPVVGAFCRVLVNTLLGLALWGLTHHLLLEKDLRDTLNTWVTSCTARVHRLLNRLV